MKTASEDPYITGEVGWLDVDFHAAREFLAAARTLDQIAAEPGTAESSAAASVA